MATRRRIGVSLATTEAARRQLMQPVPCWEKVWTAPTGVAGGSSTLKVYKWIKTEKVQQFSDDEGEADEPLAPLPDEPEVVDGDDDLDQEEARNDATDATQPKDVDLETNQDEPPSKMPSPTPQLMMTESTSELDVLDPTEGLEPSLNLDTTMDDVDDEEKKDGPEGLELDISGLGPDGLQLEGAHDLSQLDGPDGLIGGSLMDDSNDPFAEQT